MFRWLAIVLFIFGLSGCGDDSAGRQSGEVEQGGVYLASDEQALRALLAGAPQESSGDYGYVISLPLPDGSRARYSLVESSVMASALAARYPEIKTYRVFGVDDATAERPLGLDDDLTGPQLEIEPQIR